MPHVEDSALAAEVHLALLAEGLTVASAESLTGGALGNLLSMTPGASATYRGGVVSYATDLKQTLLGVTAEVIESYGVVSAECSVQMAVGVRRLVGSDWALSTTGVAGPLLQEGKPAGTVFVGVAGPEGCRSVALHLGSDRRAIRAQTCREALAALAEDLAGSLTAE
jgi:PncC family amidohydrolase